MLGEELEKLEILTMCCVCKAIKLADENWLKKQDKEQDNRGLYRRYVEEYNKLGENNLPRISHGYCPDCFKVEMQKIREGRK